MKKSPPKLSTLLMLPTFLLLSFFNLSLSSKLCHPHDKKVLLRIQKHLGNNMLKIWDPRKDCCKDYWPFVVCNDEGRVSMLYLTSSPIMSGTIPSDLGHLTKLESLELKGSYFKGLIPPAIIKLSNLLNLKIEHTQMRGRIPDFLGRLTNLDTLVLSNNSFTGSIPQTLTRLNNLMTLDLSSNKLSGQIPCFLGYMKGLKELCLSSNRFSGPIPNTLGLLSNITYLELHNNKLTGSIPKSLFGSSFQMVITSFRLNNKRLTGPILRSMGRANIWMLDLSNNKLTGEASFLFRSNNTVLTDIDLSNNRLKFDFSNVDLPFQYSLNISHNKIYGSLPKRLGQLPFLEIFDVSYNKLCGPIPMGPKMKLLGLEYFTHNKCPCGHPLPPCKKK